MRSHGKISPGLRYRIMQRDRFRCRYCGKTAGETPLHVDHVQPVSAGGSSNSLNLVTACKGCNLGKHASLPEWTDCSHGPLCTRNIDDAWPSKLEWAHMRGWWGCVRQSRDPNLSHQEACG